MIEGCIHDAIAKLRALHEGERSVVDLVACGQAAVKPLREFLFTRDSSGIFQPRCQAVEALAILGAREVLLDFLIHPRDSDDPVEQAGEDAVISAVARALIRWPDDQLFSLLLEMADRKLLPGIVAALGEYRRDEALPILAAALGEDFCRSAAENAFRKLGASVCSCLLNLAILRMPSPDGELESSRRQRRSALKLFEELYQSEAVPDVVWSLVTDGDPQVALTACSICLSRRISLGERDKVVARLIELFDHDDWMFRAEVSNLLTQYNGNRCPIIERRIP
jgi:hypothetical protein